MKSKIHPAGLEFPSTLELSESSSASLVTTSYQAPPSTPVTSQIEETILPFDPYTFLCGLWKRKWIMILGACASVLIGALVALQYGVQIWKAQTTLHYTGQDGELEAGLLKTPTLTSHASIVKLESTLSRLREELNLGVELQTLAGSVNSELIRGTSLLQISAAWSDPKTAADLANHTREILLEAGINLRRKESQSIYDHLSKRAGQIEIGLQAADKKLGDFTEKHKVVNLTQEAEWLLTELSTVDVAYEQAKIERSTVNLQLEKFTKVVDELEQMIKDQGGDVAAPDGTTLQAVKARRLREKIMETKELEVNSALLEERRRELESVQKLYDEGLTSRAKLEESRARYQTQLAKSNDSREIVDLRKELEELENVASGGGAGQAGLLLETSLTRKLDLELLQSSLDQKVKHHEEHLERLQAKLDRMPGIQKQYIALSRDVTARETEKKELEIKLAAANELLEMDAPYFAVIEEASPPSRSSESNRKLIAIMVAGLGIMATFAGVLASTLLDNTFHTLGDTRSRLRLPVIGEVSRRRKKTQLLSKDGDLPLLEEFQILTRSVRRKLPARGSRLLVTSADYGEGRSTVATYMALCLARLDQRVLLVDGHVRESHDNPIHEFIDRDIQELPGLTDFLSYGCDNLRDVVVDTDFKGVEVIPSPRTTDLPDALGGPRMTELLQDAAHNYSMVIVDSPPVNPYVDAELLAERCDGIVFVIGADSTRPAEVRKALTRLKDCGKPILGVILNGVDGLYAGRI